MVFKTCGLMVVVSQNELLGSYNREIALKDLTKDLALVTMRTLYAIYSESFLETRALSFSNIHCNKNMAADRKKSWPSDWLVLGNFGGNTDTHQPPHSTLRLFCQTYTRRFKKFSYL